MPKVCRDIYVAKSASIENVKSVVLKDALLSHTDKLLKMPYSYNQLSQRDGS